MRLCTATISETGFGGIARPQIQGAKVIDLEPTCDFSSAGFRNHFALPGYHKNAIQKYLEDHKPAHLASIWNSTGLVNFIPFLRDLGLMLFPLFRAAPTLASLRMGTLLNM
jgi:hypothetical protein